MNKLNITEETMQGNPSRLLQHLQKEIANQILNMTSQEYENTCNNMRMFADIFEMLEEHINDNFITLNYNPMGSWFIKEEETRECSKCGKPMKNGYVIENGMEYYCSDKCLHKNMTQEEYLELYDNGNGDSYWTEWEDQ